MIKPDNFFNLPQRVVSIRSYKAKVPMFFQEANLIGAMFSGDLEVIKSFLPNADYHPIRISKYRALVAISCMEYKMSDVGPYNEIALAIPIIYGKKNTLSALTSMFRKKCDLFIKELPVNTDIAYVGGVDMLNFPKYHGDIEFHEADGSRVCILRDKDSKDLILEFSSQKMNTKKNDGDLSLNCWPVINGRPILAKMLIRTESLGYSLFPRKTFLKLGKVTQTDPFVKLKLSRALFSYSLPEFRAILFEPK